jgi:hypothetical protein
MKLLDGKTKGSGLNVSKPDQNSIYSQFPPQSSFDLLLWFSNILIVPCFQTICLLSLCQNLALHSGDETAKYT